VEIPSLDALAAGDRLRRVDAQPSHRGLSAGDLQKVLDVTRALAAPFDLMTMLSEVTAAARQVLQAERASVWLHDALAEQLVLKVATDVQDIRIPLGTGMVGACARERRVINVPDCYADPRFDPSVDKRTGFRTRCALTLPLIDHKGGLVGVMQVLNRTGGAFDAADEELAGALAAQCAVALQRVKMLDALLEGERMKQELELARSVQMSSLPSVMPQVPGYDVFGMSRPATETGGDTFDLAQRDGLVLVVLGDATGHGIAPALSVTQMHAMLRMALRLGTDLEAACLQLNNLLAETMAEDRFITAFIGLLDPAEHAVRYASPGQGPIVHFHAATGECTTHAPTGFPLAAMPLVKSRPALKLALEPGDILVLLSDGIYEYCDSHGEQFGEQRVMDLVATWRHERMDALCERLLVGLQEFADGAPQEDDITVVLVKREASA
jgi:sigma-B regulation protein RsbU (phosphoserine phosphatase)